MNLSFLFLAAIIHQFGHAVGSPVDVPLYRLHWLGFFLEV